VAVRVRRRGSDESRRRLLYLGFVVAWAPAVATLELILRYGVDLPFYDQWVAEAPLFAKIWRHQSTVADFWAQHNEHRMVFPKLVYVALAWATHWNVRAELVATWALVCIVSVAIRRCQRSTVGAEGWLRMLQLLLANILLFSPAAFETWLWAISLVNILQVTCILCSLALACSAAPLRMKVGCGAALALVATFSTINGFLGWLLPLPLLFLQPAPAGDRAQRRLFIVWMIAFIVSAMAYFSGYEKPSGHPSLLTAFANPIDAAQFLLVYFGNPFTPLTHPRYTSIAQLIGGVLLALYIGACSYILYRRSNPALLNRSLVWIVVGLYSLLNGLSVTVSRLGFGPMAATWSRYVSYSIFLPLALVFLLPIVASDLADDGRRSPSQLAAGVLIVVLVVLLVFDLFKASEAVAIMRLTRVRRLQGKAALLYVDAFRDESIKTYVSRTDTDIRPIADDLSMLGLLHPPILKTARMQDIERATATEMASGALDRATQTGTDRVALRGWTWNPRTGMPADAVIVSYEAANGDSIACAVADMTLDSFEPPGESKTAAAAWQLELPTERLPGGTLRLCAWALDIDRAAAIRLPGCRDVVVPTRPGSRP